jgi:hypothetical protein
LKIKTNSKESQPLKKMDTIDFSTLDKDVLEKFGLYVARTKLMNLFHGHDALSLLTELERIFETAPEGFFLEVTVFHYNTNSCPPNGSLDYIDPLFPTTMIHAEGYIARNIDDVLYIYDVSLYCRLNYPILTLTELHFIPGIESSATLENFEYSLYFEDYNFSPLVDHANAEDPEEEELWVIQEKCCLNGSLCKEYTILHESSLCHLKCGCAFHTLCLRFLIEFNQSKCWICKKPFEIGVYFTSKLYIS